MENTVDEEQNNVEKIPMTEENCESRHSPSDADDMISHKMRPSMREILYDFTQHTTLHGVRLILMDRVGIVRRVLWFLLFLTSTVLMGIQITNRVIHYYSYPVTVDYNINFDQMLSFPTVTLCNQNKFRATAASQNGLYKLMGEIYPSQAKLDKEALENFNETILATRLHELFKVTAHKKEDLIVTCEWQNEICGPENFTEILTDEGVCYSFNDNRKAPLITTFAGPGTGLKLTLNVEQYEYMPGPDSAVGIKVLIHDRKQFPRVAEMGLSVATGAHTFVGAQLLKIKNLPKPHGACQSGSSPFYDQYSPEACYLSCMTEYLDSICGCRHVYMPDDAGLPPVCTLKEYLTCLKSRMVSAEEHFRDKCTCPAPCDFLLYDPVVSYASTSMHTTDKLLTGMASVSLRKKYLQARETAYRVDVKRFQNFQKLAQDFGGALRELKIATFGPNPNSRNIQSSLVAQKTDLISISDTMTSAWNKKKYLLQWQKYHVEMNFVSSKQELEDRTMELGYQEFFYQVESRIKQLAQASWNITITPDIKTALYIEVLNLLNARIDLMNRVHESYKQIYNAYSSGEPIFTYQFEEEPIDDNGYITPTALLNDSLSRTDLASNDTDSLQEDIQNMKDVLLAYVSLADKSYHDNVANLDDIEALRVQALSWGARFRQSKSTFFTDTVDYPLQIMTQKLDDFNLRWTNFENGFKFIENKIDLLIANLSKLQTTVMVDLEQINATILMYFSSSNNVTKMHLADLCTSEQFLKGIGELMMFFREGSQHLYKGWTSLAHSTKAIWAMILEDEDMEEYYKYSNITEFFSTSNQVSSQIEKKYTRLNNFQLILNQRDEAFKRNLDRLIAEMRQFINGSFLGTEFIKNNFLHLDVYYNEKGYELVTQQAAYDAFALFCDIGGTMALFLGASVLTLCELVDLALHHAIYRLTHNELIE